MNKEPIITECPHCGTTIFVEALNCRIFRCGIMKIGGAQINPHLCKEECDRLFETKSIYGCGKPFRIINDLSGCGFKTVFCDYI